MQGWADCMCQAEEFDLHKHSASCQQPCAAFKRSAATHGYGSAATEAP